MRLSELGGNWRDDQTKAKRVQVKVRKRSCVNAISLVLRFLSISRQKS